MSIIKKWSTTLGVRKSLIKELSIRKASIKELNGWDAFETLETAITHFEYQSAPRPTEQHRNKGRYDYIPLPSRMFLESLHRTRQLFQLIPQEHQPRFIDVGCGVGTKVCLAMNTFQFDAWGIEVNKKYYAVAKELTRKIILGDALKFKDYGKYDIIYFYSPLSNISFQQQLEHRIYEQAKQNTIIISAYGKLLCQGLKDVSIVDELQDDSHYHHTLILIKTKSKKLVNKMRNLTGFKSDRGKTIYDYYRYVYAPVSCKKAA